MSTKEFFFSSSSPFFKDLKDLTLRSEVSLGCKCRSRSRGLSVA